MEKSRQMVANLPGLRLTDAHPHVTQKSTRQAGHPLEPDHPGGATVYQVLVP